MIYITGDTHGDQREWQAIDALLQPGDTIIIAGDFGYLWFGSRSERKFFDLLAKKPYTVLFADGNHEHFDLLYTLPIREWHGGRVHFLRRNVIHLLRGEIYEIEGKRIFVFGGGYSIDKARREPGVSWWPEELPSEEEYQNAEANLARVNDQVDYIVTHTAPNETVMDCLCRFYGMQPLREDKELTNFLQKVQDRTRDAYHHWYFGHYHIDAELWRRQTALLHAVRELETGRIVGWKSPQHD